SGISFYLLNIKPNFDKLIYALKSPPYIDRINASVQREYEIMQNSVPEKAIFLARLEYPFLLNFSRNQIFLTDYVGGASPPPGIPLYQGPEPLAEYLLAKKVKYVAYSYKSQIGFTREIFIYQLKE